MSAKTVKRIKLTGTKATEVEAFSDTPKLKPTENSQPDPSDAGKLPKKNPIGRAFFGFIGYFTGSWSEIKQVRWPNRRATWGLTVAVLLFTAFFVLIILVLDGAFDYLFKEVLLK